MSAEFQAITDDGVRIAGIDYGGKGIPLVLLPGFSFNLLYLGRLVSALRGFRIVAVDPRGHGQSDEPAALSMDDFVADLDAVVRELGLIEPVVAGHSLGGTIAALYGAHRTCRAVVNIDGHPGGHRFYLSAEERDAEEAARGAQLALSRAMIGQRLVAQGITEDKVDQLIRDNGWLPLIRRSFVKSTDGLYYHRPSAAFFDEFHRALDEFDEFAVYRRCRSPLLVFSTNEPARARRLRLLRESEAELSHFRLVTLDTTHTEIARGQARAVAAAIADFVASARRGPNA